MNKRGLLERKFSLIILSIALAFLVLLWVFPVNPEDISGNLVKENIIKTIEPRSSIETSDKSITIKITTEKPATCKSSKMKLGGYYLPYVTFQRTNDYYHETTLLLDEGKNNFKFYCKQIDSKIYDYNYWVIKKV